ncbi:translation elongation factor Ts [Luteolibacter sp. Populi]|uniref:translation elongation factor Ts n=1 Tax=Luteolibacter sp. Populi TaxID=3230487 RepID=UPI00346744E0
MSTGSLVTELREKTNLGMIECKKALTETNGDLDAAIKYLREKGLVRSAGTAPRDCTEGIIAARLSADGKSGILVEVSCETDFVSRHESFAEFVDEIADTLAASDAQTLEEALAVMRGAETVENCVMAKVLEIGENIRLRKFEHFDLEDGGAIASHIGAGGKLEVRRKFSATYGDTAAKFDFRHIVKKIDLPSSAPQWNEEKNARRCALIEKEIVGTLSSEEASQLAGLQAEMIANRNRLFPLDLEELRKMRDELLTCSAVGAQR